jgi:hypothetical protein
VFVNLYNNQWSTNFTEWIEGSWSVKLSVWFVQTFDNAASLVIPSEDLRMPLRAALAEGPAGVLPATGKGVEVSLPGVLVTAFGPNPEGSGTLLRLWEQAGKGGTCRVHLPEGARFMSAVGCNLRGERMEGVRYDVRDGAISLPIRPYQPVSLILE